MFEPLTRGSTVRKIRRGRGTAGEDWQAQFAADLANAGLAPSTVRAYRHDVGLFLKWFVGIRGGEARLADLTTADVLSYRQHLVNVARLL